MRTRLPYALAVAGLLLVGAGCGGGAALKVDEGPSAQAPAAPEAMKPSTPDAAIDTGVDAMLDTAEDEKSTQANAEKNADEVGADKGSIDDYGTTSYDINQ